MVRLWRKIYDGDHFNTSFCYIPFFLIGRAIDSDVLYNTRAKIQTYSHLAKYSVKKLIRRTDPVIFSKD